LQRGFFPARAGPAARRPAKRKGRIIGANAPVFKLFLRALNFSATPPQYRGVEEYDGISIYKKLKQAQLKYRPRQAGC
jgi:hypothetical protein